MLPPLPGTFENREDLIRHVRDFGASQGYVVTIKKSRKERRVILGCDRGGIYRNRRKIDESKRKRKACSRLINCPFEAVGKKEDDIWVLTIKNGEHNHEPLRDMSEHPYSRRFTEEEVRQIKAMTEAGVKPRQVLKALKQSNPELQSTPRHLYNLKAKFRQGNISEKCFKSWRPNRSIPVKSTDADASSPHSCPLKVPNFIGGKFVESQSSATIEVINPATQEIVSQLPLTTYEEFKAAVSAAKQAFPLWKNTPIMTRQRVMFKVQELIHRDIDKLAMNITIEQGTTFKGAQRDVLHGLEVIGHACGLATLQMGEFVPNASNGTDACWIREPLGVCAGICTLNFSAINSLWMFPIAVTCGNTFILKPSEKNPGASIVLAALAAEAGLPDGVLNIVHGTNDIVNHICDDDNIKAVSFVGSNMAGVDVHERAAAKGKRVQSVMGTKNHVIIMEDAIMDVALSALVSSSFGAAGQSCMTLNTAVFVGGSVAWEEELVGRAKALTVNVGTESSADLGPMISKEVKDQIVALVQRAVESGARLVLDGRDVVPEYVNGSFIGPTILCDVTPNMECYKEEISGPVLLCMQAGNLDEAITVINSSSCSSINGASLFTTSGAAARKFQNEVEAGMVGINVLVPVPPCFSSFNGSKASFAENLSFFGKESMQFYTRTKSIIQRWNDMPLQGWFSHVPPTSETDISSRGALPSTSESNLPSRGVSQVVPPGHEELKGGRVSLPMSISSETEVENQEISFCVPSTVERGLQSQGVSLVVPPSSKEKGDGDLSSVSSIPAANEKDFPSRGVALITHQTSERMCIPQASVWNGTPPPSSQSGHTPSASDRMIYASSISQRNDEMAPTSHRNEAAMASTSERVYIPAASSKSDNTSAASHFMGLMSQGEETMRPASERIYVSAVSRRNDSMDQSSQTAGSIMHQSSERGYVPTASHAHESTHPVIHSSDVAERTTSERAYLPVALNRNDLMALRSQGHDSLSNSERFYMPTIIKRNDDVMTDRAERLYTPAASQRIYMQNSIISMEDYSNQEVSMTLPSQRI